MKRFLSVFILILFFCVSIINSQVCSIHFFKSLFDIQCKIKVEVVKTSGCGSCSSKCNIEEEYITPCQEAVDSKLNCKTSIFSAQSLGETCPCEYHSQAKITAVNQNRFLLDKIDKKDAFSNNYNDEKSVQKFISSVPNLKRLHNTIKSTVLRC